MARDENPRAINIGKPDVGEQRHSTRPCARS